MMLRGETRGGNMQEGKKKQSAFGTIVMIVLIGIGVHACNNWEHSNTEKEALTESQTFVGSDYYMINDSFDYDSLSNSTIIDKGSHEYWVYSGFTDKRNGAHVKYLCKLIDTPEWKIEGDVVYDNPPVQ